MWTVTLVSNGIKEQFSIAQLEDHVIRTIEDAAGRYLAHRYDYVAVDEDNKLATAFYTSTRVVRRKLYLPRRPRLWPAETASA